MDGTDAVAGGRQRIVGFADVVRIPLRRLKVVLAVTGVVVLAVICYLQFVPASYKAATTVVLRPVVTDPFTYPSGGADKTINMTAENGIASGNEVIDVTAQATGQTAREVRDALTIDVLTGGQVLRFEYTADDEGKAVLGANATAETYLKVRENIYKQQRTALLQSYDQTIKSVTDQRKAAQKELPGGGGNGSSPKTQAILDQVRALNDQVAQLANQRAKVGSADLSPGSITSAARAPVPSSHDGALLYLLGAVLGGLLLGAVAAHAMEAFDRRIRTVDQAADLTGARALGVVRAPGRRPGHENADARYVALSVTRWLNARSNRPLVVLSNRDDEGRSTVSGNLAVALAEAGDDVWLAAPAESQEELRKILFAAQLRTPPRTRATNGSPSAPRLAPVGAAKMTAGVYVPDRNGPDRTVPDRGGLDRGRPGLQGQDPDATVVVSDLGLPVNRGAGERGAGERSAGERTGSDDGLWPLVVLMGDGVVRLCPLGEQPAGGVVVIDAPPADTDERGVRAAQSGLALLVVAGDRTRNAELSRLVDRLRSAGAETVGFVLTGGRSA